MPRAKWRGRGGPAPPPRAPARRPGGGGVGGAAPPRGRPRPRPPPRGRPAPRRWPRGRPAPHEGAGPPLPAGRVLVVLRRLPGPRPRSPVPGPRRVPPPRPRRLLQGGGDVVGGVGRARARLPGRLLP